MRAESRPEVEARLWSFPASGRGLGSSLWVEAPAGSPSSRNAGHLGVSVHNVLLISSSSHSTAWPAPRPGGRRPWAPHTHHAQRTHNSHPKALLLLSLTPHRAPPSRPSPALLPPSGPPSVPTTLAAHAAFWAWGPFAWPGQRPLSLHASAWASPINSVNTAGAQPHRGARALCTVLGASCWVPSPACPARSTLSIYDLK